MTPVLRQGWEKFSLYLPIILMGMLALGTWWLVRNAPAPVAAAAASANPHQPDYFMKLFSVKSFDATGRMQSELTDPLVACLAGLVPTQGFLAAQIQRQMGTLHFGIGLELGHDFGRDGRITADALVEADPGTLFLGLDIGAPGARTGFLKGHDVFSKDK